MFCVRTQASPFRKTQIKEPGRRNLASRCRYKDGYTTIIVVINMRQYADTDRNKGVHPPRSLRVDTALQTMLPPADQAFLCRDVDAFCKSEFATNLIDAFPTTRNIIVLHKLYEKRHARVSPPGAGIPVDGSPNNIVRLNERIIVANYKKKTSARQKLP